MTEAWTDQPFEATFLGRPVWRLNDPQAVEAAIKSGRAQGTGLIHFRGVGEGLEARGFRKIETLVTFEGPVSAQEARLDLREAGPDDAETVASVAGESFQFDRWHADPRIPAAAADAYKAAWARNDVQGRAECVLLALSQQGAVQGFNALLFRPTIAIIDLIAVAPHCQGQGVGRRLMAGAMVAAFRAGLDRLRVGTQASNAASIGLYRSFGLAEVSRVETWHWVNDEFFA